MALVRKKWSGTNPIISKRWLNKFSFSILSDHRAKIIFTVKMQGPENKKKRKQNFTSPIISALESDLFPQQPYLTFVAAPEKSIRRAKG